MLADDLFISRAGADLTHWDTAPACRSRAGQSYGSELEELEGFIVGFNVFLFATCGGIEAFRNKSLASFSQIRLYYLKWGFPQFGFWEK